MLFLLFQTFFSLQILVMLKTLLRAILVTCDLLCFTAKLQFKVYSGSRQCCDILFWVDKHTSSSSSKVWMPYVSYWFDLIRARVHDVAVTPIESGEAKNRDGNSNSAWKLMLEMLEYFESDQLHIAYPFYSQTKLSH